MALFHHDPSRTDEATDEAVARARDLATEIGYAGEVFAAAEATTIELRGAPTALDRRGSARAIVDPVIDDVGRSVLLAVRSPEIAAILRDAAEDEDLDLWETTDLDEAVEIARPGTPGHRGPRGRGGQCGGREDFARAIGDLEKAPGGDISLIAVTAPVARPDRRRRHRITDSLEWPASTGTCAPNCGPGCYAGPAAGRTRPSPTTRRPASSSLHDLDVLDTEPESRFDRYTDMASSTFDVPIALVSLIDEDRQWFKSHHGIDATETPRDMAFCAHAILGDGVFQVPDATRRPPLRRQPARSPTTPGSGSTPVRR